MALSSDLPKKVRKKVFFTTKKEVAHCEEGYQSGVIYDILFVLGRAKSRKAL